MSLHFVYLQVHILLPFFRRYIASVAEAITNHYKKSLLGNVTCFQT